MKKLLLSIGLVMVGSTAMSQVIFSVVAPAPIENAYSFTSNGDGSNWGLANLTGMHVLDTVKIINDGTTGLNAQGHPHSAEACGTVPAGSLTGKVALIYRNDCGFGEKAYKAQQAGAVAVIMVNREEALLNMDGGAVATQGLGVNIPVVFVTASTGALIVNQMATDPVVVFIGDKAGFYNNDLSIFDNTALRTDFGSKPAVLATNASELTIPVGVMAYNYGIDDQTGVTVRTTLTRNGTEVYNQVSTAGTIDGGGDSLYFTTPSIALASYGAGKYELKYELVYPNTDEFTGDNTVTSRFDLTTDLWSLAGLVDNNQKMVANAFYRPATFPSGTFTGLRSCIVIQDPHASRVAMDGIYYGGISISSDDSANITEISGLELEMTVSKWDDPITTLSGATFNQVSQVASGSYSFMEDIRDSTVFIPLSNNQTYRFEDDQKYLVCVNSFEKLLFQGFSTLDYYDRNILADNQTRFPVFVNELPLTSTAGSIPPGRGFSLAPSIAMRVGTTLSTEELSVETSAYPNPASSDITVKVNASGNAVLKVTDMSGRQVMSQDINIVGGQFTANVAAINSGSYIFNL